MLTYVSLVEALSGLNPAPVQKHLASPDTPVKELYFRSAFRVMREGSVCVLTAEEYRENELFFTGGLFLLLADGEAPLPFSPAVSDWCLLPADTDAEALFVSLRQRLDEDKRMEALSLKLSDCLCRRGKMQQLLEIGSEALDGCPVILSDASTKLLECSSRSAARKLDDELVNSLLTYGFATVDLFEKYDYRNYLNRISGRDNAFVSLSPYPGKRDRVVRDLYVNGVYFGWLIAVRNDRPLTRADCDVLDVLAPYVLLLLERQEDDFSFTRKESLLLELFYGRVQTAEEFWGRAGCLKWTKSPRYTVAVVGLTQEKSEEEGTADAETGAIALAYKNHLGRIFPTVSVITDRNRLILLLENDADAVLGQLPRFLETYGLIGSVSDSFSDIMEFAERSEQCLNILRIGPRLKPGDTLYFYSDYSIYHYISRLCRLNADRGYILPEFQRLVRYDAQHQTEYVPTLRTFLLCHSAMETAERMHIHRNTINYRLQKIREITGLDFEAHDNLYKLWFAVTLYDLENTQ